MRVATGPETSERFARLSKVDIADIVENGAKASFWRKNTPKHYEQLLRRLQQSCYLDRADAPLTAQQRLIDQYRRDGLVLFLGAGVSRGTSDCRIPNWEGLSELMLEEVHAPAPEKLDPNDPCRVKKLLKRFDRVHECLPLDRREFWFLEKLYRCLYANFDQTVRALLRSIPKKREAQKGWPDWDKCRDALARNMSLAAVGDLLIIGDEDQWRRNANIHAVLTVNADNLLELYCRAKARGRRLVTQVDRASVGDHPYAISVYHLHGTLDIRCENFSTRCSWWNDDLLPDVVFRTSEYEETERCPFSFVNHTPLSYLQRLNILFFGTSVDDQNIVRWLRESYNERVEHRTKYLRELYRDKYGAARSEAEWETVRHFWLCNKTEGGRHRSQTEMEKVEREKRKLGVQIVWCEDYGLDCLRQLKEKEIEFVS
jgi:hypothetical protein